MRASRASIVSFLAVVGCRTALPAVPAMSYEEHVTEAADLEKQADEQDKAAEVAAQATPQWVCPGDPALDQEVTDTGGTPLVGRHACHEVKGEDRKRHRRKAHELRRLAESHMASAHRLVAAENRACRPLTDAERARTPFFDPAAIASAEHTADGARVTFRDPLRLSQGITCHRARAATMGHDPAYMPYDPTVLADVDVRIDSAIVTIRATTPTALAAVWSRVDALGHAAPAAPAP